MNLGEIVASISSPELTETMLVKNMQESSAIRSYGHLRHARGAWAEPMCCRTPGNEPHDSPLSNEETRHLREAVCLIQPAFFHLSPIASTVSTLSTSSTRHFRLLVVLPREFSDLRFCRFGVWLALWRVWAKAMLKISILDTPSHRRLVVEGKLIAPWAAELRSAWREAAADLTGRELVIDVKDLTAISEDGENVLLELMKEGIKFRS